MSDYVIRTHNLTRYFGDKCAVESLNLAIPRGSVFALMGRNGSGKTTTIRMLLGLIDPTRGSSEVLGGNSLSLTPRIRSRIGYMSESHTAYIWMRIDECARFQRGTFDRWNQRIFDSVIDHFGLKPEQKVKHLSRGQRAGLCLALTMATDPELLILDDPALGLDPVARRSLVEAMLAVTGRQDRTILFSSHLLDDVERVADHVAILDDAVLRVHAPVDEFLSRVSLWRLQFNQLPDALPPLPGLIHTRYLDDEVHVTLANADEAVISQLNNLGARSVEKKDIGLDRAVLDYLTARGRTGSLLQLIGSDEPASIPLEPALEARA